MKLYLLVFILLISACSSDNYKPRTIENYYQSAGVEKYFLSEIPAWANFSESGKCQRNSSIRFFDLDLLMKNFNIEFKKAIQIQATFNDDYNHFFTEFNPKTVPLNDEQILFFKASEKVNGKIKFFEPPNFKRINLVWIDSMLKSPEEEKKLKQFLKSETFNLGVPVLVSLCLSRKEIDEKFKDVNYKNIPSEMLSVYSPDGTKTAKFKFYFDQFFEAGQELYFYSREKIILNQDFNGLLKLQNF